VADDNNKVIISRIQNRRGLKQDLPQPLRPGEIGFAYDTRQVFIGADPTDAISGGYNKQSIFETTVGAKDYTSSIANNNIVAFTVPFKKFSKNTFFNGITKVASWLPSANISSSSSLKVFSANALVTTTGVPSANITSNVITLSAEPNAYITVGDIVTGDDVLALTTVEAVDRVANTVTLSANIVATTANTLNFVPNNLYNAETNLVFKAADLIVHKNGVRMLGDSSNATPAAAYDYSFAANASASNTHIITFRNAPLSTEEVTICYYSNTAIIQAIEGINTQGFEGNISLYNVGEKRFDSFYKAYSIPAYRQIPTELITVSTTSGTGLIGLQQKHIAVNADSGEIDSPTSLSLGNLLLSRSDWRASSSMTVNASNLEFTVGSVPSYDVAGPYNYVYVDTSVNGYMNGQVLQISDASPSVVTVTMPSNAYTVARSVSANAAAGSGVTVTLTGNVDGVSQGANILIVDGSNTTGLAGQVFEVANDPTTAGVIVFSSGSSTFASNASIQFINYGDDVTGSSKVQVFSELHGYKETTDDVDITSSNTSAIANTTYDVVEVSSLNTFFIQPTSAVVGQVTGYLQPNLANASVFVTPVRSIDLSSNTTLAEISATVNDIEDWPYLGIIPDSENMIYITHKPEYESTGLDFRLHEDHVQPTLSALSMTEGEYTRDVTVKAKLEKWINSCLESDLVDIFSSAGVGVKYATDASLVRTVGTYFANINNTYDEITFDSREEARDFNKTVNTIFFERPDPNDTNIRGLVNLKTNIELQTRSSVALGDKTVSYAELNSATVLAAGGTITGLTQSIDVYDTYKIDYSLTEASSVTVAGENYQRVGTMFISGRSDFDSGNGAVLFQDIATEMVDTALTGNVTFNASLSGTNITISAVNSVGRELSMKYIVKRWSSL
jgi:hypothetical protein